MQKDENERWDLYENLAEKTIQWESTSVNSRNSNSISSKGGLHSIESSIANEAKLSNLARRLKALETKEPSPVNQVSPNPFSTPGCTYCQAMNHVFEECPVFQVQQHFSKLMNAAFSRPNNNPYAPTYNPGWKFTRISHGAKTTMTTHGQIIQATFIIPVILPIINPTF